MTPDHVVWSLSARRQSAFRQSLCSQRPRHLGSARSPDLGYDKKYAEVCDELMKAAVRRLDSLGHYLGIDEPCRTANVQE